MRPKELVARTLRPRLGELGLAALRDDGRGEWDLAAALRVAIYYYLADSDAGRAGWRVPSLAAAGPQVDVVEVTLAMPESAWTHLGDVARAQGVDLERLVEHAALYFAADVDAGRVAERILDDLDRD